MGRDRIVTNTGRRWVAEFKVAKSGHKSKHLPKDAAVQDANWNPRL